MNLSNYIGSKIRTLRKSLHMTQAELAKILETSRQSVSRYEHGQRNTSQEDLLKLANYFQVDINYFFPLAQEESNIQKLYDQLNLDRQEKLYNYAKQQLDEQNNQPMQLLKISDNNQYITADLYGFLSAGTGQHIFDNPIEEVEIPLDILPKNKYDIMLRIVGDSMQPAFKDGEFVFIKLTKEIRNGQFVAIIVDGEAYLKKVYLEDHYLRLVSLNKKYEDIIVTDNTNIEVVGTIVL